MKKLTTEQFIEKAKLIHGNIKTDFVNKFDFNLIRIPYYKYNNIENILKTIL